MTATRYDEFSWDTVSEIRALNAVFHQQNHRQRTAKVVTFGCQLNENDSEKTMGILAEMGFLRKDEIRRIGPDGPDGPDILVLNTCCVRENAEQKLFGILGSYKWVKEQNPDSVIALCGCMMQEPHAVEEIRKRYRFVDIVFGTQNLQDLPDMLLAIYQGDRRRHYAVEPTEKQSVITEGFPAQRSEPPTALVTIMNGCNNFCSYCIVPYVRGRERSRYPERIAEEVETLVKQGYREVTLLGQNVNSYGKDFPDRTFDFSDLLRLLNGIEGLWRIRFMTSHPKDLSDRLIEAMGACQKVCSHIHLPVQAGSTRILHQMNRGYSREEYCALVEKIRTGIPGITLTTDIIVGFPGETEEDFCDTLELVETIGFDMSFTFLYSKREGTPAAAYPNQVDQAVMKERFDRLLTLLNRISLEKNKTYIGKTVEVLCEGLSKSDQHRCTGRTSGGKIVNFAADGVQRGDLVRVTVESAQTWSLLGRGELCIR